MIAGTCFFLFSRLALTVDTSLSSEQLSYGCYYFRHYETVHHQLVWVKNVAVAADCHFYSARSLESIKFHFILVVWCVVLEVYDFYHTIVALRAAYSAAAVLFTNAQLIFVRLLMSLLEIIPNDDGQLNYRCILWQLAVVILKQRIHGGPIKIAPLHCFAYNTKIQSRID